MKRTVKSLIYQGGAELSLVADDLFVSAPFVADSTACSFTWVHGELSGDFSFYPDTGLSYPFSSGRQFCEDRDSLQICATNNLIIINMSKEANYQSPACALLKVCTEGVLCYSVAGNTDANETFEKLNEFNW